MPFEAHTTPIQGLLVLEPRVFGDERGFFMESYNRRDFFELGIAEVFVQDNLSYSTQGVLRGLHFQAPPYAQAKLVTVLTGRVLDVAVDLRQGSPTYGQHHAVELSEANRLQLFIPEGFAHGFAVLSPTCHFFYKCSNFYAPEAEGGILWNSPELGIDWQLTAPEVSEKDQQLPAFANFETPFFGP
jgi:dTDP-4-dehydrorhamnose 3,5-epimerase